MSDKWERLAADRIESLEHELASEKIESAHWHRLAISPHKIDPLSSTEEMLWKDYAAKLERELAKANDLLEEYRIDNGANAAAHKAHSAAIEEAAKVVESGRLSGFHFSPPNLATAIRALAHKKLTTECKHLRVAKNPATGPQDLICLDCGKVVTVKEPLYTRSHQMSSFDEGTMG